MSGHKHWKEMAEYAKDAMETDRPWERWEACRNGYFEWVPQERNPSWLTDCEYRRKPRTININGHEVPEPVREPPQIGRICCTPSLSHECEPNAFMWSGSDRDLDRLILGIVHLTREAAEAHARALLSFTEVHNAH